MNVEAIVCEGLENGDWRFEIAYMPGNGSNLKSPIPNLHFEPYLAHTQTQEEPI
jgi:hypothetical protein